MEVWHAKFVIFCFQYKNTLVQLSYADLNAI